MIKTYVLYIALLFITYLFTCLAQRKNKKKYLIVVVILLSIISGFRNVNVGIDTINYFSKFDMIIDGQMKYVFGIEEGFKILVYVLSKIVRTNSGICFVFALVTNGFVFARMWDFRDKGNLGVMALVYFVSFYFMTMNIMRQMMAVAIVFYYTKMIRKKRYVSYFMSVILTSIFIHESALIGCCYFLLEIFNWNCLSNKEKKIIIVLCLMSPVALFYLVSKAIRYLNRYFVVKEISIGLMLPLKIIVLLMLIGLIYSFKIRVNRRRNDKVESTNKIIYIYYLLGIVISFLGYIYPFMERVGLYFYIYEIVFWGEVVMNKRIKQIAILIAIFIFSYTFIGDLLNGAQGVIPYMFIR